MKRIAIVAGALLAGVALGRAGQFGYAVASPAAAPLVAVIVARTGDATIAVRAVGHLVSLRQVALAAPVAGAVSQAYVHDGEMVRAGQLLFTVDGDAHALITAPIAGAAGALKMRSGSATRRDPAAPLVTLIQFDPIGVEFSLSHHDAQRMVAAGAGAALGVTLELSDGATVDGKLIPVPGVADAAITKFTAVFPNHDQQLWPGSFAKVRLSAGVRHDAAALPAQAVHGSADGRFVFLVDDEDRLSARTVTVLRETGDGVVVAGLTAGQLVALDDSIASGTGVRVAQ
jgi:multidrug efflux pump subunit AcrA (membrane-fusion protein)